MKRIVFSLFAAFAIMMSVSAQDAEEIKKEQEAIKEVVQTAYVEGLQNEGDLEKVDKGFHPGFSLLGIGRGNEMWQYPIYSWKESVKRDVAEGKKPKTGDEVVSIKFLSVDVTGTAASVKIEFYIGDKLTYVDYLSLYKFEDGWKIVSKIFYKFPEEKEE